MKRVLLCLAVLSARIGAQESSLLKDYADQIAAAPASFLPLFKRATLYIQLSRQHLAIQDLDASIALNPSFHPAHIQKAKLLLQQCDLDGAQKTLHRVPATQETQQLLEQLTAARDDIAHLPSTSSHQSEEVLGRIISVCSRALLYRQQRAALYEALGNNVMAIAEYSRIVNLSNNNIPTLKKLAALFKNQGDIEKCVDVLRECMKLDMDEKWCKKEFKEMKRIQKMVEKVLQAEKANKYRTVVNLCILDGFLASLGKENDLKAIELVILGKVCLAYGELKDPTNVILYCQKAIDRDPNDFTSLMYIAETRMDKGEFEEAVRDFKKAKELNEENRRVHEGYLKAQRLLKQSLKRDYYKILAVDRNASKRDIKRAFRKMATLWHPDKYRGDLDKKTIEKKMSDINQAYQVLSDDDMRQRFDGGEDPFDPEQQSGGGGGHQFFYEGDFPFGQQGGGFPFRGQQGFNFHF